MQPAVYRPCAFSYENRIKSGQFLYTKADMSSAWGQEGIWEMFMKKLMRVLLYLTFICYCILLVYLLFLNREYRFAHSGMTLGEYMQSAVNLIPFRTITELVTRTAQHTINPDIVFDNAIGNLLLFFPMGIYMPTVRRGTRKIGKFLKKMLLIVFVVEALQLVFRVGSFDVDDILLNVAGAAAGYAIWKTNAVQRVLRIMQWLT